MSFGLDLIMFLQDMDPFLFRALTQVIANTWRVVSPLARLTLFTRGVPLCT